MTVMPTKDPNATLDYGFNWLDWLGSDTISTSTWIVPDGITKASDTNTTTTTTIWLSGGSAGQRYRLVNRIVTAGGRTQDRSMQIPVEEQ